MTLSKRSAAALAVPALVLFAAVGGLSCAAHHSTNPYAPQSESDRDGNAAQKLTQEAAAAIDKDPEKAERLLREALTADLYHGPAHNDLGVILLKRGDLYGAAAEFEWARKLMPGHPDPRMNLALTLERAGRTEEAMTTYASALEVYPDHLPTLEALARLQIKSGKTDSRTRHALEEITFRGETPQWKDWAREQLLRLPP